MSVSRAVVLRQPAEQTELSLSSVPACCFSGCESHLLGLIRDKKNQNKTPKQDYCVQTEETGQWEAEDKVEGWVSWWEGS